MDRAFLATIHARILAAPSRGKVNRMGDKISGNVVQIQDYAGLSKKPNASNTSHLLQHCKNTVLERMAHSVARAMDNVDDALFALADKANNNALQSHYFDAMREIRLKRQDIEASFKKHFSNTFDELIENKQSAPLLNAPPNVTDIGLSLVQDDDLEESLAINVLVDKLNNICRSELYALDKRIGFLLGIKELETEMNPLGAKTICTAFQSACSNIDSGVDIKLIVFKLFDRYTSEAVQNLYRDINNHLSMCGVLPKIPTQIGSGRANLTEGAFISGPGLDPNSSGSEPDFLATFSQLMAAKNTPVNGTPYVGYPMQVTSGLSHASAQGIPSILHDLTLLQKGQWGDLNIDTSAIDAAALANGTANILWSIKESSIPKGTNNGDGIVIEIVALLFDYIFENQKVPDKAKALIGRLQIPILKAAMLDNSFFSMRNHPARRLLNTLAQATIGLSNESVEESALYKEIESCIQKILDEFDSDIGIFATALESLETHLEKHRTHLDENIEEAKKLIQGRERLKIAESMAVDEIERRLEGKPFPQFVRTFAMDSWKNLLIVIYMKEGQESDAWRCELEVLDLLIWSTLPKTMSADRKKLVAMLPTLLAGIEEGMKLISMSQPEQDEFLGKLANCHARAANSEARPIEESPTMDKEKANSMSNKINAIGNIAKSTPPIAPALPAMEQQTRQIDSMIVEELRVLAPSEGAKLADDQQISSERLDAELKLFGNEVATDVGQVTADSHDEQIAIDDIDDECTEIVKNMVPGIWFEFQQENGTKSMERLAWISSVLWTYLFTNHDGLKTREMTAKELEASLRSGHAVLADDLSFLVDRSFNSLLDDMQKKAAG